MHVPRTLGGESISGVLSAAGVFPDRGVWGVGRDTDASNGEVDADELEESGGRTALWSCCAVEACYRRTMSRQKCVRGFRGRRAALRLHAFLFFVVILFPRQAEAVT